MSKGRELLLECKIKLGVPSDYKLAKAMEIHNGRIADYMAEKRVPDTYTCMRMALILNRDPAEIIAIVEGDSEKNEIRKNFYRDFLLRAQQAAKLFTLAVLFTVSLFAGLNTPAGGGFRRHHYFA
jgi:hypothetical protein